MQKKAIIAIVVVVIVALVGIKLLAYWSRKAAERAQEQAALTEMTTTSMPIEIAAPPAPAETNTATAASEAAAISIEPVQPAATAQTGASSVSLLPHDVREVQVALKNAGFDPGPIDGKLGRKTKSAIRDFQLANNLSSDGKVGPKTWSKLSRFLSQGTSVEEAAGKIN